MSVQKWRFMETLTNALITPVYNSLLVAGDAAADYFGKLQGLLSVRKLRYTLITNVSGGASSTADFTLMTLSFAANQQLPGDTYAFEIRGNWTHPAAGGSVIRLWIKIGATKVATASITTGSGATTQPFVFKGLITVASIGSSGSIIAGGDARFHLTTSSFLDNTALSAAATQSTTAPYSITFGGTFSNSNASNNMTANHGIVYQV